MRRHIWMWVLFIAAPAFLLSSVSANAERQAQVTAHPVELSSPPLCSECHPGEREALDHKASFIKTHRFAASRGAGQCGICHAPAFCADCHAHKEEIKPNDKFKDSPERSMPHRGDYIRQHKVDGRVDPVSCMRCHGRMNNARCKSCHR